MLNVAVAVASNIGDPAFHPIGELRIGHRTLRVGIEGVGKNGGCTTWHASAIHNFGKSAPEVMRRPIPDPIERKQISAILVWQLFSKVITCCKALNQAKSRRLTDVLLGAVLFRRSSFKDH
ncbi:hypothetical protein ELI45_02165 [Rhizobium ruizarguesonis]|uniref:hypothetical protein n=1 Tax=Rhizobium ruizarguesonis TaxID=2081791 RepID=UPI0010E58A3C|nr:hypothetical protein [Rhizobium ruizarguesonis]TAU66763.1 hypothetical protein ELI45_02165 [Rhizobium ruizarguesonis]